jgi:peptidoglycan/LPS O-acetylase OafA/YrhL
VRPPDVDPNPAILQATYIMPQKTQPPSFLESRLRRITSDGNYIAEIDGLRFIAIISVLMFHTRMMTTIYYGQIVPPSNRLLIALNTMLYHCGRGVELFFAVSGMVLGLPFARHYLKGDSVPSIGRYFKRRLTRLEPPYLLNLFLRFPLVLAAYHLSFLQGLPHLAFSMFYIHNLVYGKWPLIHPPSWSLEVEVQFYILAPLLCYLAFRSSKGSGNLILAVSIILTIGLQAFFHVTPDVSPEATHTRFGLSLLAYFQYFLVGILLAGLMVTSFSKWKSSWMWDAISVPLWFLIFYVDDRFTFAVPILTFIVYLGAFKGRLIRSILHQPVVSLIGGMCYSIYLTHSLVLQGLYWVYVKVPHLGGAGEHLLIALICIPPCLIAFGAVYFILIERPCMDRSWPEKLMRFVRERTGLREAAAG